MTETRDTRDTRSTERRASDERAQTDAGTLGDVDHTHPETGRTFGGNFTFARGGTIAADGGRPDVVPEDGDDEASTLKDVDHTPPNDSENANRVFERGEEAREEGSTEAAEAAEDSTEAADAAEDSTEAANNAEDVPEDE